MLSIIDFIYFADAIAAQVCPTGWVKYKYTKCVKFFPQSLNQTEAHKSCRLAQADLVSIQNSDEDLDFLLSFMSKETLSTTLPAEVWLGGMRVHSRWFWLDLSWFKSEKYSFDEEFPLRSLWSNSEPVHNSWSIACMTLKSKPAVQQRFGPSGNVITIKGDPVRYKLSIRECGNLNSYFCQKELEVPVIRGLWDDKQNPESDKRMDLF